MIRSILGVIVGYSVWTVCWLGGNAILFSQEAKAASEGTPVTETGTLAGLLGLSFGCSLVAGVVTALVAGIRRRLAVYITGSLLLLTGIGVEIGSWGLLPAWYHLVFLVMLMPMVCLGARLAGILGGAGTDRASH